MKAIGHLLERVAAAEAAVRRRAATLTFAKLSPSQCLIVDAHFKETTGLADQERRSQWVAFLRRNEDIATRLYIGPAPNESH